jgi:hypothetical protein
MQAHSVGLGPRLRSRPSLVELLQRARLDQSAPNSPSLSPLRQQFVNTGESDSALKNDVPAVTTRHRHPPHARLHRPPPLSDDSEASVAARALQVASHQPLPNSPPTPEFPSPLLLSPSTSLPPPRPVRSVPIAEELRAVSIDSLKMPSVSCLWVLFRKFAACCWAGRSPH